MEQIGPNFSQDILAYHEIGEETLWLEQQLSVHTRRAYFGDVQQFMKFLDIKTPQELLTTSRAHILAWRRSMEEQGLKPRTILRRLASLSCLFKHLLEQGVVDQNPVDGIKHPASQTLGTTPAFSSEEAIALLNAPDENSLLGLRDRAILSLLLQAGLRRSEVASLAVKDFFIEQSCPTIQFFKKGNRLHKVFLHLETGRRIESYLSAAAHGEDTEGSLFRSLRGPVGSSVSNTRSLTGKQINEILKKYALDVLNKYGYASHSCRTTFITFALQAGARIDDVQRTVGHAHIATTQGYDRNVMHPSRSSTRFAVSSHEEDSQ